MAEEDTSQEKTEEATPKRLEKSREDGQTARSKELNTSVILLAGTGGLMVFGSTIAAHMENVMRFCFSFDHKFIGSEQVMLAYLARAFDEAVQGLLPFYVVLLVASILGPISLGGWLISATALMPKFDRLNPLEGIKRMFSLNSLVELLKAVGKVGVVASLAVVILMTRQNDLLSIGSEDFKPAMVHALWVLGWSALALAASTLLIALIDVPYQLYDHAKKLKMTMQEVKDEMKDTEGKPEVKGRIRQLQRELAQRRMMGEVPEADVVITNPTHYSVALKYDNNGSGAPVVVAKGVDVVALKIREIAVAHEVYILEAPPLARAIYYTTDLDNEIPEGLYLAVAQVLAYVFQIKSYRPGRGRKPREPKSYDIPEDLRYEV